MKLERWVRYGTHQEALAWAAANSLSGGDVLEVGAGWWSTPWLHGWCDGTDARLYTVERDPAWASRMAELFACDWHLFEEPPLIEAVSLALVDGEGEQRFEWVKRLAASAAMVVVHDTERHDFEDAFALYSHRRDFRRLLPHTTVVW